MANAGTVNVNLVAQTAAFVSGIKEATEHLEKIKSATEGAKHLLELFGVALGAKELLEFAHHTMEGIDQQAKMADRLGITTEAMGELGYAAELSGIKADTFSAALSKMEINLSKNADTLHGNAGIAQAITDLGISTTELMALKPDEQFTRVAEGISKLATSGDRARVSVAIFGKTGAELLPLLNEGGEGVEKLRKEAEELGIGFSRLDAEKVIQANDAMNAVKASVTAVARAFVIELAPYVTAAVQEIIEMAKHSGGFKAVAVDAFRSVRDAVASVADVWNVLMAAWDAGRVAINMIGAAWANLADMVTRAIQWWTGLWNNWVQFVQDTTARITTTVNWLWSSAKVPIGDFVQFAGEKLSSLLYLAAEATARVNSTLSTSLQAAAGAIGAATGDASAKARNAAKAASDAMEVAAANVKASWAGMFNIETTGSEAMRNMAAGFMKSGEQAAVDFMARFRAVINRDASTAASALFSEIEKKANDSGKKAAERVAKDQAEQEEARKQAAALAEIEETALKSDLTRLRKYINLDILAEDERFEKEKKRLNKAHTEERISDAEHKALMEQAQQEHADKILAIDQKRILDEHGLFTKATQAQVALYGGMASQLTALLQASNGKNLGLLKAARIAETIINTAAAAMANYNQGAQQGGPYLGAAYAAIAIATGAIQIAAISSAGGGGGGGGSVSNAAAGGYGHDGVAAPAVGVTGNETRQININFTGLSDNQLLNGQQVRQLIEQLNEAHADGSVINVGMAA